MGSWPSKLNSVTGKRPLRDNLFGLLFWTNWDGIYNWNNYADIYCIWIGKRIYNKICDFKINWCEKVWQWCGVATVSGLEVDCNSAPTWGRIGTLVKQICGGSYVSAFYVVIWLTWKSKFQCKSKFHLLLNFVDFAGGFLTKSPVFCYN